MSEDSDREVNEYYFESDHVALKGNKDYMALLKTIVILEAQRAQAIKDLDELLDYQANALKDPISFVAQLQNSDLPTLPGPKEVAEIPTIDWSRYNVSGPDERMRPQTRHGNFMPTLNPKIEQDDGKILVRGRAFDETKPETFNQLWTREEQRRLEELLIIHPPEETEMKRWKKIAKDLGNRTAKQVSSRCQKYFAKLEKLNLPIPGRGSKVKIDVRKSNNRHQRNNHHFKPSTFFPHENFTDEKEDFKFNSITPDSGDDGNMSVEENDISHIDLIRRVKKEKQEDQANLYQHFGYKCSVCSEEPLKGTRWNCTECRDVNLCSDCAVAQLEAVNPIHPLSHKLKDIGAPESLKNYDTDYLPQNFDNASYNYLDPNFLPE